MNQQGKPPIYELVFDLVTEMLEANKHRKMIDPYGIGPDLFLSRDVIRELKYRRGSYKGHRLNSIDISGGLQYLFIRGFLAKDSQREKRGVMCNVWKVNEQEATNELPKKEKKMFKSLVEMSKTGRKVCKRGYSRTSDVISYAVHKQSKTNEHSNPYRVVIAIGSDLVEDARLRAGDFMDVQLDFDDGDGVVCRAPEGDGNGNGRYPKLGSKTEIGNQFRLGFVWTKGMPFYRGTFHLSNVETDTGEVHFEFPTKLMDTIEEGKKLDLNKNVDDLP